MSTKTMNNTPSKKRKGMDPPSGGSYAMQQYYGQPPPYNPGTGPPPPPPHMANYPYPQYCQPGDAPQWQNPGGPPKPYPGYKYPPPSSTPDRGAHGHGGHGPGPGPHGPPPHSLGHGWRQPDGYGPGPGPTSNGGPPPPPSMGYSPATNRPPSSGPGASNAGRWHAQPQWSGGPPGPGPHGLPPPPSHVMWGDSASAPNGMEWNGAPGRQPSPSRSGRTMPTPTKSSNAKDEAKENGGGRSASRGRTKDLVSLGAMKSVRCKQSNADKEKGRGSYRCGKCGVPKKGHVCPYQPKIKRRPDEPAPVLKNASTQVEMDEFLVVRRLNLEIQGYPETYCNQLQCNVGAEPHPYATPMGGRSTSTGPSPQHGHGPPHVMPGLTNGGPSPTNNKTQGSSPRSVHSSPYPNTNQNGMPMSTATTTMGTSMGTSMDGGLPSASSNYPSMSNLSQGQNDYNPAKSPMEASNQ